MKRIANYTEAFAPRMGAWETLGSF